MFVEIEWHGNVNRQLKDGTSRVGTRLEPKHVD